MVVVVQIVLSCSRIFVQGFKVKQCLLWVTCTGRHWLIALWITIGATYLSVTASGAESLYYDLSATPWR